MSSPTSIVLGPPAGQAGGGAGIVVPDVVNALRDDAVNLLKKDFDVRTEDVESLGQDGTVLSQNPQAGQRRVKGSTVTLLIRTQSAGATDPLAGLKADVGTVKADVGTVKADVGTVKTDVGTVTTDVGTVKADVGTVKADLAAVKAAVDKCEREDDAATRHKAILDALAKLTGDVGKLAGGGAAPAKAAQQ